jgi:hypothetical protein
LALYKDPSDSFLRIGSCAVLELATGNNVERKTFAIATLGAAAIALVSDLLAPTSLSDVKVSFPVLKDTLQQHLASQYLEIAERATFFSQQQHDGESLASFYSRLKKSAEHCNFGDHLEEMLRDRLVLGCRSKEARQRLLAMHPLWLGAARDTLVTFEAGRLAHSRLNLAHSGADTTIHYHDKRRVRSSTNKGNAISTSSSPAIGVEVSSVLVKKVSVLLWVKYVPVAASSIILKKFAVRPLHTKWLTMMSSITMLFLYMPWPPLSMLCSVENLSLWK